MFKIYSSSAGSGKTYTLTREYLKLALHPENDSYYRHILAVTFTNAAAQEMKERILNTLREFSKGTSHPMIQDIVTALFPATAHDPELRSLKLAQLRERSSRIFTRILHGYSDFSVMTIDSFMSRLVGSFTDELGLPFGFETRLDSDLLTEAIDRLLSRIGLSGEETLTGLLESYYLEHAREEGAWGALPRQMLSVASDLLNEQSYLAMTKVSDLSLSDWQQIRKQLLTFVKEKESGITASASRAYKEIVNAGLGPADFFQSSRGIYGYFAARSQPGSPKLWEAPNSYAHKTVSEDNWQAKKIPVSAQAAMDGIIPLLTESYRHIESIREAWAGYAALYRSLAGQLYNLSLLNEIKREFDLLLRQNNQVHISEFNRKVIDIVANDPVPFIFERLGEKYNHILIDEFQDTSRLQFANLLPLIDNALSNGYFNLIVGDVKQAIYRFRGGDMELLLKLSNRQAGLIDALFETGNPFMADRLAHLNRNAEPARLSINRRSFSEITSFNNSFFRHLSDAGPVKTPLLSEVYDEYFEQETGPSAPSGGHVSIEFFDREDDSADPAIAEDPGDDVNGMSPDKQGKRVISLIGELLEEGYNRKDIAILCRFRKNAARLAVWLQEAGVPLISDDSLLLSNSLYVNLIVHFIKVVHTPDNGSLRLEAAILFHRVVQQKPLDGTVMSRIAEMSKEPGLGTFLSWLSDFDIHFDASEIYQLNLYELCEQVLARFDLLHDPVENQYIFRFLDEVLQFENTRVSHPGDFLNWWETSGQALSITASSETDAIRITTIHKSKGLEYPVVLFPYADWKATPKPGSRLWVNLEKLDNPELSFGGKTLLSAAVPLTKSLEETPVGDQYRDEVQRVLLENINLAYVAFTRPVQRLYILAGLPTPSKESGSTSSSSVNQWLQSYLESLGEWDPDRLQYELFRSSSAPVHAHLKDAGERLILEPAAGAGEAARLSLRKNAGRIFNTDTFEKERDLTQKVRQALILTPSASKIPEILKKNIHTGLLRPEDYGPVMEKAGRLLALPPLDQVFDPSATRLNSQIILKGGEILEADRFVKTKSGDSFIVLFATPGTAARGRITRLLQACRQSGLTDVRGLIADPESETLEILP